MSKHLFKVFIENNLKFIRDGGSLDVSMRGSQWGAFLKNVIPTRTRNTDIEDLREVARRFGCVIRDDGSRWTLYRDHRSEKSSNSGITTNSFPVMSYTDVLTAKHHLEQLRDSSLPVLTKEQENVIKDLDGIVNYLSATQRKAMYANIGPKTFNIIK